MTPIVIDANLALALAVPLPYSDRVEQLFDGWREEGVQFAVPALWGYEVVSGLRKAVVADVLTKEEADSSVQHLWAFDLEEIPATIERHHRALEWAERISQKVAYDAQYLVVAEEVDAQFWTADQSLVKSATAAGADWVHWIGGAA